jgi:hypothetical protein
MISSGFEGAPVGSERELVPTEVSVGASSRVNRLTF